MKHTPGPWIVGGPYPAVSVIYPVGSDDTGDRFKLITQLWDWEHDDPPEEVKANARLIAAAPELLEACEAYHFVPDCGSDYCDDIHRPVDVMTHTCEHWGYCRHAYLYEQKVEAAIAKAKVLEKHVE